jgi:tyrosinase
MLQRREVLAVLGAIGVSPLLGLAPPPPPYERMPWGRFVQSENYAHFLAAISALKANKDPLDPGSWWFWASIHEHHCPHGKPYFLAWHRGYLWLFERKLREVSGFDNLRLPYWDYFNDPNVPPQFEVESAPYGGANPLWEARKGTNIAPALTYTAFDPAITAFERGKPNAFEARIESSPHNNIHNIVGGKMATMQSPQDVLFWMHHANVDRLWSAWIAGGKAMPAAEKAYWNDRFEYGDALVIDRRETMACEHLGYRYADLTLPKVPPPPPPIVRSAPGAVRPPRGGAAPPPRNIQTRPGGGFLLGDGAVTVTAPISAGEGGGNRAAPIPRVMSSAPGAVRKPMAPPLPPAQGVTLSPGDYVVVLDDVTLTDAGTDGGYFYKVYLDLPGGTEANREERLLGTIGPFQIATAMPMGGGKVRLTLPANELVLHLAQGRPIEQLGSLSVSFVRIDADRAPSGAVIGIGSFRIERATGEE